MSNHAIANRIFVTERTIEAHIKRIFDKLGLVEECNQHRSLRATLAFLQQ
jgi:DNA-binding NarL/FixJ family response regulator